MRGWLGAFQGGAGSAPGPGIRPPGAHRAKERAGLGKGTPSPEGSRPLASVLGKKQEAPCATPETSICAKPLASCPPAQPPVRVGRGRAGGCTLMGFTGRWEEVGGEVCGAAQEENPHWLRGRWSSSRKDSQFATLGDFTGSWGDSRKWEIEKPGASVAGGRPDAASQGNPSDPPWSPGPTPMSQSAPFRVCTRRILCTGRASVERREEPFLLGSSGPWPLLAPNSSGPEPVSEGAGMG